MKKNIERKQINRIEADINVGLSLNDVEERKLGGYQNKVTETSERTIKGIIFHNIFTFFNTILFIIASVFLFFIIFLISSGNSDVVNDYFGFSKFVFLIPAIMNITIGTIQEIHSKHVLDNLKIISSTKVRVIRDKKEESIDSSDLVIDDIVLLKSGEQATADFILVDGFLQVDESMLTGESKYIKKMPGDKIFSGSSIIIGNGKARTIEVGNKTYASLLSSKVKSMNCHKSELMTNIMFMMKILTIILGVVAVVTISTLMYKISKYGNDPDIWDGMTLSLSDPVTWARIMVTVGSFSIGVIPSGLVLTTSVTLVVSIASLAKKNTLIQELYSLENLSRIDIICLDKTGTMTDGTMKLVNIKMYDHLENIVYHIMNLIGVTEDRNQTIEALYNKFGLNENVKYSEIIPFSSETKYSGLIYENNDKVLLGAPEYLLDKDDDRLKYVSEKAKEGFRVLALKLNDKLMCFFVIEDTIRESAKDTLKFFYDNNVDVKIISGDNPHTVSKISEKCGVKNFDKYISLEGVELDKIKDLVDEYTIFARVSPEQKEAIVIALQEKKHKVAMTGDGVNDILALRRADSSITFSKATDAAKSVSDGVLLDNDFSHLKDVVGQGRRVISNIQRVSILFLMKSFAIGLLAFMLIGFKKAQMWYSVENAYLLESAVIGTGGFVLSIEWCKNTVKGSFYKNIFYKGLAAGILATIAITLPIALYSIPKFFGNEPIIQAENIRTMMSVLLVSAGIIVAFSLCVPFNKYRVFAIVLIVLSAVSLSMMFPTSFICGQPTGPMMFSYDSSIGQSFMDCQFMREFFKPWNSIGVKNFVSDWKNFIIILIFVSIALPLYLLDVLLTNKKIENE